MPKKGAAAPSVPAPPADRIAWLLRFLRVDVPRLSLFEMVATSGDLVHYVLDPNSSLVGEDAERAAILGELRELRDLMESDSAEFFVGRGNAKPKNVTEDDGTLIPRQQLLRLQKALQDGIRDLTAGRPWTLPSPPKWQLQPQADGSLRRRYEGELVAVLLASAADLLAQFWPQIRLCKNAKCGAYFWPREPRHRYHDPECSASARYDRWKGTRDYAKERERDYRRSPTKDLPKHIQNADLMAKRRKGKK